MCVKIVVERSEAAIKSVELQLVRVETCGCAEGYAKECECTLQIHTLLIIIFFYIRLKYPLVWSIVVTVDTFIFFLLSANQPSDVLGGNHKARQYCEVNVIRLLCRMNLYMKSIVITNKF